MTLNLDEFAVGDTVYFPESQILHLRTVPYKVASLGRWITVTLTDSQGRESGPLTMSAEQAEQIGMTCTPPTTED